MIRALRRRAGSAGRGDTVGSLRAEVGSLRAEVADLRAQNEKLRRAMRQCVDCEYRIEVLGQRAARGATAAGGDPSVPEGASPP